MLTLNDGRNELWQWDTGRKLTVDAECSQIHFSNKVFGRSIDVDVIDGVATIPDILLQTDKDLNVWAFVGTAENGYTKISKSFKVNRRNKPADYVFTPPEQTTLAEIMERLDDLEAIQDPDAIKNAVDDYLASNPIQVEETDPTVPDWAKQPTKPKYTAAEVGAIPDTTEIPVVPTKVSAFENDAGYLTEHQDLSGYAKTAELPKALPNPHPLTFTGAVDVIYDGSKPVEVVIPSGGNKWTLLADVTLKESVRTVDLAIDAVNCKEIFILQNVSCGESSTQQETVYISGEKSSIVRSVIGGLPVVKNTGYYAWSTIRLKIDAGRVFSECVYSDFAVNTPGAVNDNLGYGKGTRYDNVAVIEETAFKAIRLQCASNTVTFSAGSSFKVWWR